MYQHLNFGRIELESVMRAAYDQLIDFVTTQPFKTVMAEMNSLKPTKRPAFVASVLLNDEELSRRGVQRPSDILIQRSAFGDRRPTLFCVKKLLPEKYACVWKNVNITFDNEFEDSSVSRDADKAWRIPLPVHLQAMAMAEEKDLEQVLYT
jgi:hypothetical protein